ncbi:MAG TPA: hypothetical protein VJU81_16880 [Methylomirabilota bacterium]|nr:hypothetical protein [Methylomirabilota bacterium]
MGLYLFVVSKTRPELCDYLREHFADELDVEVTLDRRQGERRRIHRDQRPERRLGHRRWRPENDEALETIGAFLVALEPRETAV